MQLIEEQGTTTADISKTPTVLFLNWFTKKPIWVNLWSLTIEKLQALGHLVEE